MPLTEKGKDILAAMKKQYGSKKGESVFYASMNKGIIKGVEKRHPGNSKIKNEKMRQSVKKFGINLMRKNG